jgi:hypothetical protein
VGSSLPLNTADGTAALSLDVIGADGTFAVGRGPARVKCGPEARKGPDPSDNRNSVVTVLRFGPFRLFDGGDLTWNAEADLACAEDRVGGPVDVFQINHHGLDNSNNPVLVESLAPRVVVINNGPKKGGEAGTYAALQKAPSRPVVYQVHRSVRFPESNTAPERIANEPEECAANYVKLAVEPDGRAYTVSVPATRHTQKYEVGR